MVRPWAKGQRNIGDTSSAIKLFADWKKSRCWQQHKTKRECKTVMFLFKLSLTDVCFWNMTFFSGWANAGVLACFSSPGMHVFTKTKWLRLQEPDPITFAIKIRMPILAKNINYKNRWVYYRNITKYISTIQYPFSEKKHGRVFTKQIFGPTIQLSWLSFCSIGLLEIIERSFLRHGSRGEVRGLWSMEEVLHQVDMENGRLMSCVYRFLYIPSGTWFLPSTVSIGVM